MFNALGGRKNTLFYVVALVDTIAMVLVATLDLDAEAIEFIKWAIAGLNALGGVTGFSIAFEDRTKKEIAHVEPPIETKVEE